MPSDYEDLPTLKSSYGEAGEEIGKGKGARP